MQRSFEYGEIGSSLFGGARQEVYQQALKTCLNFFVMRHGGVANRAGFEFVTEVKDSSVRTYLLKFVFNEDDAYLLEVGEEYIRFIQDASVVTVGSPDAWLDMTDYEQGGLVVHGGVNYYCLQDHTSAAANDEPGAGTNTADFWYAQTGDTFEIPTPYQAEDLANLQTSQDGDILTITSRNYPPYELRRYPTRWTLTAVVTAPSIAAPASLAAVAGAGTAFTYDYVVTAVKAETLEESLPSGSDSCACDAPTDAAPNTLSWGAVSDAAEYNVYLDQAGNGVYGYIGTAASNSFNDPGIIPDLSETPPTARVLFAASGDYPQASASYQQRRLFAATDNDPQLVNASRTGFPSNFSVNRPLQDDDAVTFRVKSRAVSDVRHMVEAGRLIILTGGSEGVALGDQDGILTPGAINLLQHSYYGSSLIMPVVIGNTIVFVQARARGVRDLNFEQTEQAVGGRDLTLFAPHLFDKRVIERMDYAAIPHSIVWCVRDDGYLLGMTYVREMQAFAWHRHNTVGYFEDARVLPEGKPDIPDVAAETPPAETRFRPLTYEEWEDPVYVNALRSRIEDGDLAIDADEDFGESLTRADCQIDSTRPLTPNYAQLILSAFPEPDPLKTLVSATVHVVAEVSVGGATGGAPESLIDIFNAYTNAFPASSIVNLFSGGSVDVAKTDYTHTFTAVDFASTFPGGAADIFVRAMQGHSLFQDFSATIHLYVYDCWVEYLYA